MKFVDVAEEIAAATRTLAIHRLGAVIVWDPAAEIYEGVVLDARVSRQLIITLFLPESLNYLRNGLTVIRGDRVERAAVLLGWTEVVDLDARFAISVDADTGLVRILDESRRVRVVLVNELVDVLRLRAN